MQKVVFLLSLLLLSVESFPQDCTPEKAKGVPTILEKGFDKKPISVKDATGKKLGDNLYSLFAEALQQTKGLHGNFNIADANDHLPGLLGYDAFALLFTVYCNKEGKMDWKGLANLKFSCWSNYISEDFADEVSNELVGEGGNHFVYLDNNLVYMLEPRKQGSEINGYPYIEKASSKADNVILITRPGLPLFSPLSRKQYLGLMKKTASQLLSVEKKALEESIKTKAGIEDAIQINIKYTQNDLKEIDAFVAAHNNDYLTKPCITNHNLESLFGTSFKDDKDYFFDATGTGKEWVIINPKYINKNLPAMAPQLFCVSWREGEKDVEKKAASLFKQIFDFKKLQTLLAN